MQKTTINERDSAGKNRIRILCCDDDASFLDYLKSVLGKDFNVTCLNNGASVITHCESENISLVLLDYHMPPPNGLRVLSSLKHNSHTKDIPVIVTTCESTKEDVGKLVAAGADDFLLKPFQTDLLTNKIQSVLEKRQRSILAARKGISSPSKSGSGSQETKIAEIEISAGPSEIGRLPMSATPPSLEQVAQINIFKVIQLVSEMFSSSDNQTASFSALLESALFYSKMEAGAILARENSRDSFALVSTINIEEDALNEMLAEQIDNISLGISHENKNCLLFKSEKNNFNFLIYPLRTRKELLGLLLIRIPNEKWFKELVSNQSLLYYLTVCNINLCYLQEQRLVKKSMLEMAKAFSASLDARDPYTKGHSDRVTMYAMAINAMAEKNAPNYYIPGTDLILVAQLHDIGKIGIADQILCNAERPTPAQLKTIKQHVEIGRRMLSKIPALGMAVDGTSHHERYDGLGYPDRLVGDKIPLVGRILAVADAFDNLTTSKPYKKGLAPDLALKEINKGAGTQYDPVVCGLFTSAYKEGLIRSALDFSPPEQITPQNTGDDDDRTARVIPQADSSFANKIISRLEEIAFGSPLTHELVVKLSTPQVKFAEVAKMVETSAMLSAKILRAANSAFYGFSRRIRTVEQAIVMLGLNATRHIIHLHNMLSLYKDLSLRNFDINRITQHSLMVGLIARHIAKSFHNRCLYEDAFLAGIMHDIGKMPLIKLYPEKYESVVDGVLQQGKTFAQAESDVFGITHSEIGAHIWQKWSLPVFLGSAIQFLHDDQLVDPKPDSLTNIIKCANDFAYRTSNPCVARYPLLPFPHPVYNSLNLTADSIKNLLTEIESLILENQDFIKLATM